MKIIKYHSVLSALSNSDLAILESCHRALFTEVLSLGCKCLELGDDAGKSYLVVPLEIFPSIHPLEMCVDFDLAQRVSTVGLLSHAECFQPVSWPCTRDVFHNALVKATHNPHRLYTVQNIDTRQSLQSPFPDATSGYASFADYFGRKYGVKFSDPSQPALVCKALSDSSSRLKLLTSRYKTNQGESLLKSDQRGRTELLFPELCAVHILPANFWKLTRCLPSILWRIESLLLVEELRSTAAREMGLSHGRTELTTCTRLRGYEDHGFGGLKTQRYVTSESGLQELSAVEPGEPPASHLIRGPDNALLLQALTTAKAIDSVNLERLETLGDSFLKIATSVFLFCERPGMQEGKLTSARSRRIGNRNLLRLAQRKGTDITGRIFSTNFDPKQTWLPPGFKLREAPELDLSASDKQLILYCQSHRVMDKGVADTVESLIGAYLVSGGIEAAIRFMRWMCFKIFSKKESVTPHKKGWNHSSNLAPNTKHSACLPLLMKASSQIFSEYFGPMPALSSPLQSDVTQLLQLSTGQSEPIVFQERLGWVFSNPALLLQALTHASFTGNKVTGCYQRLEFLGDAVLDYLVTCHIYSTFPKYGPGEITEMRSALVSNVMFAELAVRLSLHKALLHSSPLLFSEIPKFVEALSTSQAGAVSKHDLFDMETATITETKQLLLPDVTEGMVEVS